MEIFGISGKEGGIFLQIRTLVCSTGLVTAAVLLAVLSLYTGAKDIQLMTIVDSFIHFDSSNTAELIIRTLRWPRLLAAVICGVSFAVSGALMQGITHNPMASPSILGINAGASFGLAVAMILLPAASLNLTILFAFAGAAVATGIILLLAGRLSGRATPVYLALAGTAVSAVFTAVTQMMVVFFDVAQDLSYWTAGGIRGGRMEQIYYIMPWTAAGCIVAVCIARSITLLNFGEEVAIGLGARLQYIRVLAGLIVLVLSGSAVALAGPIGFVGLVVPHIVRKLVGYEYRRIIPVSALTGMILVVCADMVTRVINPPYETPLGAVTALIGVPFFIYLANRTGGGRE